MDKVKFEAACRRASMVPVGRYPLPEGTILIADGFVANPTKEFPWGHYRTMFVIERGDLDIGSDLYFDAMHDPGMSKEDKRTARVNATLKQAVAWMELNKERYDA